MDFSKLVFAVDGDSITAYNQWSYHVYKTLGFKEHVNIAVGSSVWYKKRINTPVGIMTAQDYNDPNFAGISDGWEPTEDVVELQKRLNNCAIVHVQKYISDVKKGILPAPDVFAFAFGTNDELDCLGDADKALTGKSLIDNENINLHTVAGAMRWCLQTIYEEFPNVRVFVLTPIQSATPERNVKNMKLINQVLRPIAGAFCAQVVDCYNNSGIIEKFEVIDGQGKYLLDGLHPAYNGQELQGKYVSKEIKNNIF